MAKQAPNPLRADPTRTLTLRAAFIADMRRRFAALRRAIWDLLVEQDAFGLQADAKAGQTALGVPSRTVTATAIQNATLVTNVVRRVGGRFYVYSKKGRRLSKGYSSRKAALKRLRQIEYFKHKGPTNNTLVTNTRWRFLTDDAKLEAYRTWLKGQTDAGILGVDPQNANAPWTQQYISSAYSKGLARAYTDAHAAKIAVDKDLSFVEGGKAAFLQTAFGGPIGQTKLKLLSTRAYSQLQGVTAAMDQEMSRILAQGIADGKGPRVLARELTKSIDGIEKKRALTIARTEIIHAHAEGQLDSFEAMGIDDVSVMAEWSTAQDSKVCPMCQPMEGVILTIKEARGMIPRHPNCRCAWIPAGVGEEEGGTTKKQWAGDEQGLEKPGTKPTGKVTGQVWHKDEVAARIRESLKAESPKLSTKAARANSKWVGADLTTVSGKLKPGTKAAIEAKAAAKRAAAKKAALQAKRQAAKRAAAAKQAKVTAADAFVAKWAKKGIPKDATALAAMQAEAKEHLNSLTVTGLKDHPSYAQMQELLDSSSIQAVKVAPKPKAVIPKKSTPAQAAKRAKKQRQSYKTYGADEAEAWGEQYYGPYTEVILDTAHGDACYEYSSAKAFELNGKLRAGETLDKELQQLATDLDAAIYNAPAVPENVKVYRYVGDDFLAKKKVGDEFVEKGFMSTALDRDITDEFIFDEEAGALFTIRVQRGSHAVYLNDQLTQFPQTELTLPRNSKFRILSKKKTVGGPTQYELELLTQPTPKGLPKVVVPQVNYTDDAAKAVVKWKGTGAAADVLDYADYSGVAGWGPLGTGSSKTQSYGILLFDDSGRVLLREPTNHYGGAHWTFAKGGGVKPGSVAFAELGEETGYKANVFDILPGKYKGTDTQTNFFIGKAAGYDPGLMDTETAAVKWMTYDEALTAIAQSPNATVVARDTEILKNAYTHLQKSDRKAFVTVVNSGSEKLAAEQAAAKKAAHSYKVKTGLAQKHYTKEKFGGGVLDADYVNPATKMKLAPSGVNKVLSEKGWHTTTLPKATTDAILDADDLVTQKAVMDGLKKAPKGVKLPTATTVRPAATPPPGSAITASDFKDASKPTVEELDKALSKGTVKLDGEELYKKLEEWTDVTAMGSMTGQQKIDLINSFKASNPAYYTEFDVYDKVFDEDKLLAWARDAFSDQVESYEITESVQAVLAKDTFEEQYRQMNVLFGVEDYIEGEEELYSLLKDKATGAGIPQAAPTVSVPLESQLKKVRDLPGSTKPYLAKDTGGKLWVVKDVSGSGIAPAHLRSEDTADELYRVLGLNVPSGRLVESPGGPMKVTEYLEGGQTLADWQAGRTTKEVNDMYKEIRKGFVADALFANHDVAGMSYDNIMVVGNKAYRIDNGGALTYRAQGAAKRTWGPKVTELATMRSKDYNPQTAALYKGITKQEIEQQIRHIVANREALLVAVPDDAVRATLASRIDDLAAQLPKKTATKTPRALPGATRRAVYGNAPDAPARVRRAKSNGVTIAGDRDLIEDNNMLVWEELDGGKRQTMLQFKVTKKGSDRIRETVGGEMSSAQAMASTNFHPEDEYYDAVLAAAKTVNFHAGDKKYNDAVLTLLTKKQKTAKQALKGATGDKKEMLEHYIKVMDNITAAKKKGGTAAQVVPYVLKQDTTAQAARTLRRDIRVRKDSGISFRLTNIDKGLGKRKGGFNKFATKEAYTIDAGEGIEIKFIPSNGSTSRQSGLAMHGTVSVSIPEAANNDTIQKALDIVDVLGIDATPPSPAYEEALYLHRGIYMQGKHGTPDYISIWETRTFTDEERVAKLKHYVKQNMGIDVDKVPSYDPTGKARHADGSGFRHWDRWDVTPDDIAKNMEDYALVHTTGNLTSSPEGAVAETLGAILDSGGEFTSTTGRIRKGVAVRGAGASTEADISTGGASYFFTRIRKTENPANGFYFRIGALGRQDAVTYPVDKFGAISDINERAFTVKDYKKYAAKRSNETLFKEGLSIDDLDFIRVRSEEERAEVLAVFEARGIKAMSDGRPVQDIVVATNKPPKARRLK